MISYLKVISHNLITMAGFPLSTLSAPVMPIAPSEKEVIIPEGNMRSVGCARSLGET